MIFLFYNAERGGWMMSEDDVLLTADAFRTYDQLLAWAVMKEYINARP